MNFIKRFENQKIVETSFFFFSIQTYTHVQFGQLHKYIQNRNEIYKKWYTQKQFLDIKLFVISRKQ